MADSTISREEVLHVARLARLSLGDDEVTRMTDELGAILGYVRHLQELDTSGLEPTSHVAVRCMPLRDDEPLEGVARDAVLEQSPNAGPDGFVVPAFREE